MTKISIYGNNYSAIFRCLVKSGRKSQATAAVFKPEIKKGGRIDLPGF